MEKVKQFRAWLDEEGYIQKTLNFYSKETNEGREYRSVYTDTCNNFLYCRVLLNHFSTILLEHFQKESNFNILIDDINTKVNFQEQVIDKIEEELDKLKKDLYP